MEFLSWDCANRTLAWVHATINFDGASAHEVAMLKDQLGGSAASAALDRAKKLTENFITIHSSGIVDILEGKKVDQTPVTERTRCLRRWLEGSAVSAEKLRPACVVLIEGQPPKIGAKTNNKSTVIENQLMFYYANFQVNTVSPKLKNKLAFHQGLVFDQKKYADPAAKYRARKRHAVDSLLYFYGAFGIRETRYTRSTIDDLADAFMQIFAYIKSQYSAHAPMGVSIG
jgi:hypothetical protein